METKRVVVVLAMVFAAAMLKPSSADGQFAPAKPVQIIAAPPDPAPLPNATAYFGAGLAVDGNTAIFAPASGRAAYVYTRARPGQPWSYSAELVPPSEVAFFAMVALDGDVAVLSAAPTIYIFERSNGVWTLSQSLTEPEPTADSDPLMFGYRAGFDHGVLAVGNPTDDNLRGAVYVFERDGGGTYRYRQKLRPFDGTLQGLFGFSAAVDGQRMIVGAPQARVAYAFRRRHGGWVAEELLPAPSGTDAGNFGYHVALDGRTAIVSAPSADLQEQPIFHIGGAFVYRLTRAHWQFEARLHDPLENEGLFGDVVGVQGDKAVVQAWGRLLSSNARADRLVVFERRKGKWTPFEMLTGLNEGYGFGYFLAWSGRDLFTSADSTPTPNPAFEGEVYYYAIPRH